ncbi:MAG: hypothetical protein ACRD0Z_05255 [Acidimicrobiales bacterium]
MASDGNWYPPELHPDARTYPAGAPDATTKEPQSAHPARPVTQRTPAPQASLENPPLKGWWLASDGNWYPPEQHADPAYRAAALRPVTPAPEFAIPPDNPLAILTRDSPKGPRPVRASGSGPGAIGAGRPTASFDDDWRKGGSDPYALQSFGPDSDSLIRSRAAIGGPVSAVPPVPAWDSDTYAVLPTRQRQQRRRSGQPRSKLATVLFFLVLLVVVGGAVVLILVIHHGF